MISFSLGMMEKMILLNFLYKVIVSIKCSWSSSPLKQDPGRLEGRCLQWFEGTATQTELPVSLEFWSSFFCCWPWALPAAWFIFFSWAVSSFPVQALLSPFSPPFLGVFHGCCSWSQTNSFLFFHFLAPLKCTLWTQGHLSRSFPWALPCLGVTRVQLHPGLHCPADVTLFFGLSPRPCSRETRGGGFTWMSPCAPLLEPKTILWLP